MLFTMQGRLCPAAKFLPGARLPTVLDAEALRDCFLQLCRRSVYAYEDELKRGYFTVQGGCRIGVAGCRGPGGFSAVTSLNLRIARWLTCPLPSELEAYIATPAGGLLLAGPPGSGKTTLLRSLVQKFCEGETIVSVIDERGELMACESGSLPRAARIRCDVYARCTKAEGIAMALRCMNPRIIVCDELGTPGDAEAVAQGVASGVIFLAAVHCDSPEGLRKKPQLAQLLATGAFEKAAFLVGPCEARAPWFGGWRCDGFSAHCRGAAIDFSRGWRWVCRSRPHRTQQRQCHAFARLLAYLAELLEAQALAGPELLARAARCPAFSACCPAGTAALSALRPPDCLPDALCREIAETLAAAEESPRLTACAALRRLAALCEAEADELAARAHDARQAVAPPGRLSGRIGRHFAVVRSGPKWTLTLFSRSPLPASSLPF